METKEILSHVDHTLLAPTATWEEVQALIDEAIEYGCASVCIPQTYVAHAAHYIADKQHYGFNQLRICTVVGFPNGYTTPGIKCMETEFCIADGATEIDMVINLGWVKEGQYDKVLQEINSVKASCHGNTLKVIIECCLLTDEEKIRLCEVVSKSGADYIKTSTGFAGGGATREDVALLVKHMTNGKKVKAAGGIATLQDAEDFLALGADRLGTSRVVKAVKAAK
ncbi:MAG: deoxyribose-phosphate aldolase [Oscillospiraceae bacterium]|nr:deoxyribose-phosphate aldolase [Oscillospiraceae bacterium]